MKPLTIELAADGDHFLITVPGNRTGHTIAIPMSMDGVRYLTTVLRARQSPAILNGIGTASAPTQGMVDEWLKDNKVTKSKAQHYDPALAALIGDIEL